ncbi:abc subfamily abcg [Nannochloropsis oceanica]
MSDRKLDSEGAPQALRVLPPPIRTGNNDENDKEDTNQTFLLRLEKQGKTDAMNDVVSRVGSIKAQVMEWNVAEYKVKLRKGGKKTILQNVVGRAEAGFFSAILGPSGCGKTSLLDCVALRNSSFTGALRLDGQPLTSKYFLHTGYVHQKELLFSHLTVREHLTFHSVTRLSRGRTTEECLGRVEAVLQEVDMVKVGDSQIGGGELYVTKGLSGGERKRLNIATELLADPSILLLDEPTSGLDSVMGELICLLLHDLARRDPKRIVLVAVHSPSSRIFSLFSHLTILSSNGELAYFGLRQRILSFLEGLGYACPKLFNPADFVLELASTKTIQNHISDPMAAGERVECLAPQEVLSKNLDLEEGSGLSAGRQDKGDSVEIDNRNYSNNNKNDAPFIESGSISNVSEESGSSEIRAGSAVSSGGTMGPSVGVHMYLRMSNSSPRLVAATKASVVDDFQARLGEDQRHQKVHGVKGARSSQWALFKINLWRAWIQESREKIGLTVRAAMTVTLGLLFGLLYLYQIPKDKGRNTAGFLFSLLVTMLIASSVNVCLYFPFEFAILMREYYAGGNLPIPYFLGRTLASVPQSMLFLLMGIIPYFMAGLAPTVSTFGYFVLILFLSIFSAQSLGYLASSFTSNPVVSLSILPLFITPMILFSGMLYERHSVPAGLQWIQEISVINYSFGLLVLNQVEAVGGQVRVFLHQFLQVEQKDFSIFLVNLIVLALGYRLSAMIILMIRVRFISKPQ